MMHNLTWISAAVSPSSPVAAVALVAAGEQEDAAPPVPSNKVPESSTAPEVEALETAAAACKINIHMQ
jgi:hypothetical protein